jgi:hypothetical protein
MTILPVRLLRAVALAACACACSSSPAAVRGTFDAEGLPRVDVTIAIQSDRLGESDRDRHAAFTTLKILGTWLAPFPDSSLSVTPERTPWWTSPAAMAPEFAVARAVSRRYWERVIDTRALPPWFVGGLSEYSARRAVSKIVDEQYLAVYRSRAEGRYFGGLVPRDLRVQLRVEDEGDPVGTGTLDARMLLTLGTLERWTGRPVFDAILLEFVNASAGTQPAVDDFARVASRVSGQNLSWLFDEALKKAGSFDYAIEAFDSRPQGDGTFRTTVTVRRAGDAVFGRGLLVVTTFADGEAVREACDGRRDRVTYEYRSPSPAVSAEVDPDRVLLLDVNRSNNGVTLDTGPARTAAARWSARWMIWLEDALLTYVAFT